MNKPKGIFFYIGWVGNLITCFLSVLLVLFYCYYLFDYLQAGKLTKSLASFIVVIYHAFMAFKTIIWLKNPKSELAFIFLFYWILGVFVWLLVIIISLADFTFIGQQ